TSPHSLRRSGTRVTRPSDPREFPSAIMRTAARQNSSLDQTKRFCHHLLSMNPSHYGPSPFGFPLTALSRRRTRRASRLSQRGGSDFELRPSDLPSLPRAASTNRRGR